MKPVHGILIALALIGFLTYTKTTDGKTPFADSTTQTQEHHWTDAWGNPVEPTPKLIAQKPSISPKKVAVKGGK